MFHPGFIPCNPTWFMSESKSNLRFKQNLWITEFLTTFNETSKLTKLHLFAFVLNFHIQFWGTMKFILVWNKWNIFLEKEFRNLRSWKYPPFQLFTLALFWCVDTQSEIQKISAYKVCLFLKLVSTALRQIVQNVSFWGTT